MGSTKKEIREEWLQRRLNLSEPDKNNKSFQIEDLIFKTLQFQHLNDVNIFLPVQSKCEVRTWNIIQSLQTQYTKLNLSVPRIKDIKSKSMESIQIERHTCYVLNKWGIDEPAFGPVVNPESIDLIFLPLITFDKSGHRLGYGGGFYDRYLIHCHNAIKIGLSFFDPIEQIPEINEFDVKMDMCITPDRVYKFNPAAYKIIN